MPGSQRCQVQHMLKRDYSNIRVFDELFSDLSIWDLMLDKLLFLKEDKRTAANNKLKLLCQSWSQSQRDYKAIEFYFILFTFNYLCQIDACSAHSYFLQIKWVYKWRTGNSGEFGKLIKQIIKCDKLSVGWNKFVQWNMRHWGCRRTIEKCSVTLLQYWKTLREQL